MIDGEKVIASAKAMVSKELRDHGWNFVNIDDAWQGNRGGKLNAMQANEKFPNFKKMIDDIHAMGLKVGVYSTPWITSYAGYMGASSNFENGIPAGNKITSGAGKNVETTDWGLAPSRQFVINAFDNSAGREKQDIGLDGLPNKSDVSDFSPTVRSASIFS